MPLPTSINMSISPILTCHHKMDNFTVATYHSDANTSLLNLRYQDQTWDSTSAEKMSSQLLDSSILAITVLVVGDYRDWMPLTSRSARSDSSFFC